MLKLVVGLGNPGSKYASTLHNIGFLVIDRFVSGLAGTSRFSPKENYLLAEAVVEGHPVWFMKPQTFMNLSGQAVGPFARYHRIPDEDILVIHDEVDFDFGRLQLKKGGGTAGHNGLKSILEHGPKDFFRLRIGVGKPPHQDIAQYVLEKNAMEKLEPLIADGCEALGEMLSNGFEKAARTVNGGPSGLKRKKEVEGS